MGLSAFHHRLTQEGPRGLLERALLLFLLPAGWLYGLAGLFRVALYRLGLLRSHAFGVPVISIGNLAVGGTGKTPAVDFILRTLMEKGVRVAVVSRGYGGRVPDRVGVVSAGKGLLLSPTQSGDEPYLLARRNPGALVLVAPRRAEGVRRAIRDFGAEVVVLDDGFQHLAVRRDLDIVLLDARRPLGNGRVLPAGRLREFPLALRRADLVVFTRSDDGEAGEIPFRGPALHCRHRLAAEVHDLSGNRAPLASLAGKAGLAFAGIADPENFFSSLRRKGLFLGGTLGFPDHAPFGPRELERLGAAARTARADYLVTTEKDGVKLTGASLPLPCWQVGMSLEFHEKGALEMRLEALLRKRS